MQKRSRAVRFKRIGCGTRPLWAMETAKRTRLSVRISPRETLKSKGRLQWSRSEENGVETVKCNENHSPTLSHAFHTKLASAMARGSERQEDKGER